MRGRVYRFIAQPLLARVYLLLSIRFFYSGNVLKMQNVLIGKQICYVYVVLLIPDQVHRKAFAAEGHLVKRANRYDLDLD